MPVFYDNRNRRWRFQLRRVVAGRAVRTSRLLPKDWGRAEAEAFDRAETARLFGVAAGTITESPSIERAIELWLDHKRDQANTIKAAANLAAFLPYYEGKTFADLPAIATEYIKAERDTLAAGTIRNRLAYLRSACNWAWKHHGMGDQEPGARMVMPVVKNERRYYLSPADVNRLATHCGADMAAIIRLAFYCGLRWVSELLPRTPADVCKIEGTTWLHVGKTKNSLPRMVPVHPAALADLKRLPFDRAHWRTYYAEFEAARKAIGRPEVTMHDLRHSLASAIISQGGTLSDVQGALHHESVQSSARYAHLYPSRLKAVLFEVGKKPAQKRRKIAHTDRPEKPKKSANL
jgi:integrase